MGAVIDIQIRSVGIDLGKTNFHLVALSAAGKVLLRKKVTQKQLITFTANMQTSLIGMEKCSGAHCLGRVLREQGYDVTLIPAQFVKPFVKSNNDFLDAEAIAEAVDRQSMRFVPIKTDDQLGPGRYHCLIVFSPDPAAQLQMFHTHAESGVEDFLIEGEDTMPKRMGVAARLPWTSTASGNNRKVVLKHQLMLGVIGALLSILVLGCAADKQPSSRETSLANAAKDVTIPLEAGKMKNPLPENEEVVSQGQEVFLGSCAQCHGAEARGDGDLGRKMSPPAMDLTSAHVQHWSDAELFWIIQNGVRLTGMPSWKSSISDSDTWKLARFIHSLPHTGAVSGSTAIPSQTQAATSTQDKYTLKVPNGLAFSEFRGYESWPLISISHNGGAVAAILGNPVMIDAYKAGIPGNGMPFPDGAKMAKVHWNAKVDVEEPGAPTVPGSQHDVDFMLKDSKRFADSGGWGYGVFEIDAASGRFRLGNLGDKPPQANDAKCGFTCHTKVKAKDYVFTAYGQR